MRIWIVVKKERNYLVDPYTDINTEILEVYRELENAKICVEYRASRDKRIGYVLKERGVATQVLDNNEGMERTYTVYSKELYD